mmetsp:Transcript_28308/g.44030  ORF Transcript_28308/g.44030 Transcript_28308/m.44030 type:complete len:88 (-) Transcript_28308:316-579(-)
MFSSSALLRSSARRIVLRQASTAGADSSASAAATNKLSTAQAVTKVASLAAFIGAGSMVLFAPTDGDSDFLEPSSHCHDEDCTHKNH